MFHAYVTAAKTNLKVQREPEFKIGGLVRFRPDFSIEIDGERIILEFKRKPGPHKETDQPSAKTQLYAYMKAADTRKGVVYFHNFSKPEADPVAIKQQFNVGNESYEIVYFHV